MNLKELQANPLVQHNEVSNERISFIQQSFYNRLLKKYIRKARKYKEAVNLFSLECNKKGDYILQIQ